jgi:glucose/arabinose dehydrogenase
MSDLRRTWVYGSIFTAVTLAACADTTTSARADVSSMYNQNCASCHGPDLTGGLGPSLIDDEWDHGSDPVSVAKSIKDGFPSSGMPGFSGGLSDEDIRSLVIYISEQKAQADSAALEERVAPHDGIVSTQHHNFRVETVFEGDGVLWSAEVMPDGKLLVARKDGALFTVKDGARSAAITGTPDVWDYGQGGLLDVGLHPDYETNGWVYLSFAQSRNGNTGMTAVVRGRIQDGAWVDEEMIFETSQEVHGRGRVHFGTRLNFHDGYLYFGIGDRGEQDKAQSLMLPNGKIHRVHDDGRIPEDNPFAQTPDGYRTIWSYGHRNPQGLDRHPETGALYNSEHGPRGGDEINLVEPQKNYGWPVITYGMNYNGTPITSETAREGMEQPVHYWVPSIAVSAVDFYDGSAFEGWTNDLLVGGLGAQVVERLRLDGKEVVEHEVLLKNEGRVRDIIVGLEGEIYVVVNTGRRSGSAIRKLVPVER